MFSKAACGAKPRATEELRIVMVGKTGCGKSASGNTILGRKAFESVMSSKSITDECFKAKVKVDGQDVAIIDTPGLFDTIKEKETIIRDVSQCITYASPGPHVFLIVIALGRYTKEEMETVEQIQKLFGEDADRYSMVLFTRGGDLEGTTIEKFIEDSPDLQDLVNRCHGQYHVFNNKVEDDHQVTELLQKIRNLVKENKGSHYNNGMFKEAERAIEEEKQRILKEKEEEIRKEKEQLKREMQADFDEKLKKVMEEGRREDAAKMEAQIAELKAQNEREWRARERNVEVRYVREARRSAEEMNPVGGLLGLVGSTIGSAVGGVAGGIAGAFKRVFSLFG